MGGIDFFLIAHTHHLADVDVPFGDYDLQPTFTSSWAKIA